MDGPLDSFVPRFELELRQGPRRRRGHSRGTQLVYVTQVSPAHASHRRSRSTATSARRSTSRTRARGTAAPRSTCRRDPARRPPRARAARRTAAGSTWTTATGASRRLFAASVERLRATYTFTARGRSCASSGSTSARRATRRSTPFAVTPQDGALHGLGALRLQAELADGALPRLWRRSGADGEQSARAGGAGVLHEDTRTRSNAEGTGKIRTRPG